MSDSLPNTIFSVFAFIGFLLAGFPLPWHIHSWNTGTSMYMLWTSFGCLILFVNSIVWNDNVMNLAPVWCDISAHYLIGASVGIPASSLCTIRRLYYITKLRTISVEVAQRRREILADLSIGIGFPFVVMAWQYIVEDHRFSIIEWVGCFPSTYNTPLAYFLVTMWPLCIGLISLIYAVLTFRRAFLQKEQLKRTLYTGLTISAGRYWRLMTLCTIEITFTVPLSLYNIIINAADSQGVVPYVSWDFVHSDFDQIPQYPAAVWQNIPHLGFELQLDRWIYVLCAFGIFAFFGWAQDVRHFYCQVFWSVFRLGHTKSPGPSLPVASVSNDKRRFTHAGKSALPVHDVGQKMKPRHLSMPVHARVRNYALRTSLSFELPLDAESGLTRAENLSWLTAPSVSASLAHISCTDLPATPQPVLARDRQLSHVSVHELV